MTSRLALLLAAAACAACAPMATRDNSPQDREVRYRCDNGESVALRFFPTQGVATLVRGGRTMELQQQPAGSGFVYSNGPNTVRGKGDELMLEIGRMAAIRCQAG
jgi:membrane-bound inhibitor of C-type lysozyme